MERLQADTSILRHERWMYTMDMAALWYVYLFSSAELQITDT